MAVSLWKQAGVKRSHAAIYFVPILTLFMILCGVVDVRRHKKITVRAVSVISGSLKRLFYKNWSFIR